MRKLKEILSEMDEYYTKKSKIIIANYEITNEISDSRILLKLIHLKQIKEQNNYKFLVTSEMNEAANQELAKVTKVNDLVVGSNIINLILTQISENRDLARVFRVLLESEGSEIYTKSIKHYIKVDKDIDFYALTKIVAEKNEILVGYKRVVEGDFTIVVNPNKLDRVKFTDIDELIVLAED